MTGQAWIDRDLVRSVAAECEPVPSVELEEGEIVIRGGGVTERYDHAEMAIDALRTSWGWVAP